MIQNPEVRQRLIEQTAEVFADTAIQAAENSATAFGPASVTLEDSSIALLKAAGIVARKAGMSPADLATKLRELADSMERGERKNPI